MSEQEEYYEQFKIKGYKYFNLFIHENQSYLGRSFVWLLREGEMQRLSDLSKEEREELFVNIIPELEQVLRKLWQPDHINYAWLGNHFHTHKGHGHLHIIPRYKSLRKFNTIQFTDERWGENYAPAPKSPISKEFVLSIKEAMITEFKK